MSESPKMRGGGSPLGSENIDNPLVKELQCIMSRSHNEEGSSPIRVSPTTGVVSDEFMETDKDVSLNDRDHEFTNTMRMIFCNYFVEHFVNYEHFIIMPDQTYTQWIRNREQFENFDKTAFLSDQPISSRTFYSAFLETAMFTLFIDQKLIATWDPAASNDNLVLFDKYIENHRHSKGIMTTPSSGTTPCKFD